MGLFTLHQREFSSPQYIFQILTSGDIHQRITSTRNQKSINEAGIICIVEIILYNL